MSSNQVVVHGHVRPDGTLAVDQRVNLPPGPVNITVEAASEASGREETRAVLEDIWAQRKALGLKPRSKAEIDAEIEALRNEAEDEVQEIERLYDEIHSKPE